jgi:capsule polysaccharide modification protein KpsS
MTRKEFERIRIEIEGEKFSGDCSDPIAYGIERAAFEREKFKRLIAAARQVPMQTARAKLAQWKRQLERATQSQERFQKIRDEIKNVRPNFFVTPAQPTDDVSASSSS